MKKIILIILVLAIKVSFSQTTDFFNGIKEFDISDLFTLTEFKPEYDNDTLIIRRKEPIGFIGKNFQRFYIHFISVIKNPDNNIEYFVYGKTKVKNNICSFQGTLILTSAEIFKENDIPNIQEGFVKGKYNFYENLSETGSGVLKGNFISYFFLDGDKLKYNAYSFVADGFNNNQFEGTWTSYKTKKSRICNWGDYRIPNSRKLDEGAAEFGVSSK